MDFKELISALDKINQELREQSIRAVNTSLTLRNWFFGFYIVEFEKNGKDRADYGKALLASISDAMKGIGVSNADERELRRYRQFYFAYPIAGRVFSDKLPIRGILPPELPDANRGSSTPDLRIPSQYYMEPFNRISFCHFSELIRVFDLLKKSFY